MQHRQTLSIVVPAYNEAESLPHLAEALHTVMQSQPYAPEIILVDDGSSDSTPHVMESLRRDTPDPGWRGGNRVRPDHPIIGAQHYTPILENPISSLSHIETPNQCNLTLPPLPPHRGTGSPSTGLAGGSPTSY